MSDNIHDSGTGAPAERDPVGRLLRMAGRREAVPAQRAARVKASLQAHWSARVAARRRDAHRRRALRLGGGLAIAASIALAVVWLPWQPAGVPVGRVLLTAEGATAGARGEPMRALDADLDLTAGTALETAAAGGITLALVTGHELRIDVDTRVRLEPDLLVLDRGAVYLDSGTDAADAIVVTGEFGNVRDIGTQFEVRLTSAAARVRVREGQIVLERPAGQALSAGAGEQLTIDEDGSVRREAISRFGPEWSWVGALAASFDIEGRAVGDFLAWLSRENGWTLRYDSTAAERLAASVSLHGSVAGLSAEDALVSVMATTRLDYELNAGVLTIFAGE